MNAVLKIGLVIGGLYVVSRAVKYWGKSPDVKNTDATKKNFDDELNYTGGTGHHGHGGGGNWRNPYILAMPYYGYPYNYYQQQPEVCYTKTKTGKLLAHYCNDLM